jgi:transglutaminase-like putative cysteine protease
MVGSSHLRTTTDFPYKDEAWHRWIEVYLPPYGWIPFDATIDRGKHPSQKCSGSYDYRTLRVSRGGVESDILGQSYVGCSNHTDDLERERYFVWAPLNQAGASQSETQPKDQYVKKTSTGTKP